MLRFWITVSLLVTVVFTGIGLVVSREWGWSEYASDELYVVYVYVNGDQTPSTQRSYFLVNTDGEHTSEALTWRGGVIQYLNCSANGRVLALWTNTNHLATLTEAGILYDYLLDGDTPFIVANDGTVSWTGVRVNAEGVSTFPVPTTSPQHPDPVVYDGAANSPSGVTLWSTDTGMEVHSANGTVTTVFPGFFNPRLLASGQIIDANGDYSRYLLEPVRGSQIEIPVGQLGSFFSPDGTKVALIADDPAIYISEIFVADAFTYQHIRQLTHWSGSGSWPLCFLTFRPQMLIADSND
jgi:hypothetical protein